MKPLKEPGYVQKRVYHLSHQVPGHGICEQCGQFARVTHTDTSTEFKTQYRKCPHGHQSQVVVRIS